MNHSASAAHDRFTALHAQLNNICRDAAPSPRGEFMNDLTQPAPAEPLPIGEATELFGEAATTAWTGAHQ